MKKKLIIAGLILVTILMGFLRDGIFVSLNKLIESGSDVGPNMVKLKWGLTVLFSVMYLLFTGGTLQVLFGERKYLLIALFCYAALFAVAALAGAVGYFFSSFEGVYPFIRAVLGVAQSPVVMIVLIPACFLNSGLPAR